MARVAPGRQGCAEKVATSWMEAELPGRASKWHGVPREQTCRTMAEAQEAGTQSGAAGARCRRVAASVPAAAEMLINPALGSAQPPWRPTALTCQLLRREVAALGLPARNGERRRRGCRRGRAAAALCEQLHQGACKGALLPRALGLGIGLQGFSGLHGWGQVVGGGLRRWRRPAVAAAAAGAVVAFAALRRLQAARDGGHVLFCASDSKFQAK